MSDKGWMGWKRRGSKPIELVFHFDSRRIFTNVVVFSSNRLDLGIQVFRRAVVWILDKDVDATGLYHEYSKSVHKQTDPLNYHV